MSFYRNTLRIVLVFALPLVAFAAAPITGTVTDKTTGRPAAGDTVTLIRLAQGMQDSTTATTDAHGRYKLQVPDDGLHLVRVTHQKATYFKPAPQGTTTVDLDVYDAADKVPGITTSVEEMHIETATNGTSNNELHIVEVLQVSNHSQPAITQFGPAGYDFYLPAGATLVRTGAMTDNGMPVQTPAIPVGAQGADPGHYKFLFPIRPGDTQFGIIYSLPYTGKITLAPKLTGPVTTMAVLLPRSMTFAGPAFTLAPAGTTAPAPTSTYLAQNLTAGQSVSFTLSGNGSLPRDAGAGSPSGSQPGDASGGQLSPGAGATNPDGTQAATANTAPGKGLDNPLDPEGSRNPLGKYQWWILGLLALAMAAAAGLLLRKPTAERGPGPLPEAPGFGESPHLPAGAPTPSQSHILASLKEEMFALETDRLQGTLSEADYATHKAALELVLKRALRER